MSIMGQGLINLPLSLAVSHALELCHDSQRNSETERAGVIFVIWKCLSQRGGGGGGEVLEASSRMETPRV